MSIDLKTALFDSHILSAKLRKRYETPIELIEEDHFDEIL